MTIIAKWASLSASVRDAGLAIFATASIPRTAKGFADENVLALTLLARTVSNVKGATLLLDAKRIVEARTIVRCCFENLFWTVGLAEEGEAFVRKMRDDEMIPMGGTRLVKPLSSRHSHDWQKPLIT